MKKFDESEGYWRTIGGRRVFIKAGQSLSDAMRESGKFNKKKKENEVLNKNKYEKDDDYFTIDKKMQNLAEEMDKMTDNGIDNTEEFKQMEKEYDKLLKKQNELYEKESQLSDSKKKR